MCTFVSVWQNMSVLIKAVIKAADLFFATIRAVTSDQCAVTLKIERNKVSPYETHAGQPPKFGTGLIGQEPGSWVDFRRRLSLDGWPV